MKNSHIKFSEAPVLLYNWTPLLSISILLAACQTPTGDLNGESTSIAQQGVASRARAERARMAASRQFLYTPPPSAAAASAEAMAAALDVPAFMLVDQTYVGSAIGGEVLTSVGTKIHPRRGADMVVLSTGSIVTPPFPEPGTDIAPSGPAGDAAVLRLELDVPEGANHLSFDYNFMSSEYPDFLDSEFNDEFIVRITEGGVTEEFALASVNDSAFFAASDSRALGSGYDIYTLDPSDVDFDFAAGIGVPDAGITDFQTFEHPLAGGGSLVIEFDIHDQFDGLVDSQVVIDNLDVRFIEVVDPNDILLLPSGQVTTDLVNLSTKGSRVRAAAADGVTRLVVRTRAPGPGTVTFSLAGSVAPEDGGFSSLGETGRAPTVTVPVFQVGPGISYAFALYTVPESFNYDADGDGILDFGEVIQRPVLFHAEFESETGARQEFDRSFELVRPPVVIIPGIWSGCHDWETRSLLSEPKFSISCQSLIADKNPIFAAGEELTSNVGMVRAGIAAAFDQMRTDHIAVTQADVVGHTMGGVVARMHIDLPDYRRIDNFQQGDVNRLITVNTPHLGARLAAMLRDYKTSLGDEPLTIPPEYDSNNCSATPLCRLLAEQGEDPVNPRCVLFELECARTPIDRGAVDDLVPASEVLYDINRTVVPSHALYGTEGWRVPDESARGSDRAINSALRQQRQGPWIRLEETQPPTTHVTLSTNSVTFGAEEHDLFSVEASQKGGIDESATTRFPGDRSGRSTLFNSDNNGPYGDRIVELLDTPLDALDPDSGGPLFSTFEAPRDVPIGPTAQAEATEIRATSIVVGGVALSVSPDGVPVHPGDRVNITLEPRNGFPLEYGRLVAPDGFYSLESSEGFDLAYTVPTDSIGEITLYAIGYDNEANRTYSNSVNVPITLAAVLQSVEIVGGEPVLVGLGSTQTLTVRGHYDDGVTRDITSAASGTVYQTANPAIVTVSATGSIAATGPGITTVVARNGDRQASVSVTVLNPNHRPIAAAGPDQTVACDQPGGTVVTATLDGTASFDTDGDTIIYQWFEDATSVAEGPTPTLTLSPGTHLITLIVSDGEFNSEPDTVEITIDECPPPVCPTPEPPVEAYCQAACQCGDGVGDCDGDEDCLPGMRCVKDIGLAYGYIDPEVDVCVLGCPDAGVGTSSFCTSECPCEHGEGDCDADEDCVPSLRCMRDVGLLYGYDDPEIDVCVEGCPDIGVGTSSFCTPECPCAHGEGDCDHDEDCEAGLKCEHNVGIDFGYDDPGLDVCVDEDIAGASSVRTPR
ncbi:choice-of-anchor L domain-containing protein [Haliangium sp.]|uniref:PGAP1-like alpha/beta domain-containing protein n=1 Tax=Haliangium sp. TaxID=2663208 RepID=UPI003D0C42F1